MLASGIVSRNNAIACAPSTPAAGPAWAAAAPKPAPIQAAAWLPGRSIVLVGMPGSGKSSIGRRLSVKLGLPFLDADTEIEAAAGLPITEIFSRYGEPHFRDGERRVITRLLAGPPVVLATGGGAFADARTRAAIRASGAVSVWLRCRLPTLLKRVAGRDHRPMFLNADPAEVLQRLMTARHPLYAEADLVIQCTDESPETTTRRVQEALEAWQPPARLPVTLGERSYDIVVGEGLLERAGALLAPVLPSRRIVVVTDETVAPLHLPTLRAGLEEAGFAMLAEISVPPGEASKDFSRLQSVLERMLAAGADRWTAVIALGGGVVGDLAGFAAAVAMRGMPFVQVPTTLLAQVDSSVGGKTGVNLALGKNLVGAFHQPRIVLADMATLRTLPPRELRAGYAEVAKHGLLSGETLWRWCEGHGAALVNGDAAAQAHAVLESCRLKAAVVAGDEREESAEGGRALLNLGHTFGHALEAESGYGGGLLHGEAVGIGLGLAAALSARLGQCSQELPGRVISHLEACGMPARIRDLPRRYSVAALMGRMRKDKKVRDGALRFVLLRGPGEAFTAGDVPPAMVESLLRDEGCEA
ncbi:3-dehydroquinate synthase [Paracraurococcus lichenis]|uniref:Multifunctional fusion protein n=1 Tax=Paracraurococcus lichenis TaxID=3064888 RepID=A0ABT9E6Y4_9PROT|nr:3-dehydroquinate synthase [Paracraurococcus sp. LOR1-02]MDO9711952.1 3-dehydroquinate synthase [Paracraurococcus sp. LOR1-02]